MGEKVNDGADYVIDFGRLETVFTAQTTMFRSRQRDNFRFLAKLLLLSLRALSERCHCEVS
jgi:hypothetical protein